MFNLRRFNPKKQESKEKTLAEAIQNREGVVINWKKLNEKIKDCEQKEKDNVCRRELKDIGISFVEE